MVTQEQFVKELVDNVLAEMLTIMATGRIPETWDGIELRQWLADRFADCVITSTMSPTRRQAYRLAVVERNLYTRVPTYPADA